MKKIKRPGTNWKKVSATHNLTKFFSSRIYKELRINKEKKTKTNQ